MRRRDEQPPAVAEDEIVDLDLGTDEDEDGDETSLDRWLDDEPAEEASEPAPAAGPKRTWDPRAGAWVGTAATPKRAAPTKPWLRPAIAGAIAGAIVAVAVAIPVARLTAPDRPAVER